MHELVLATRYLNDVLFLALGLVALGHWRRRKDDVGLFSDIVEAISDRGPLEPTGVLVNSAPPPYALNSTSRPVTFACPSCHHVYSTKQARELHLGGGGAEHRPEQSP